MDFGHLGLEVWVMVSGLRDGAQVWGLRPRLLGNVYIADFKVGCMADRTRPRSLGHAIDQVEPKSQVKPDLRFLQVGLGRIKLTKWLTFVNLQAEPRSDQALSAQVEPPWAFCAPLIVTNYIKGKFKTCLKILNLKSIAYIYIFRPQGIDSSTYYCFFELTIM